MEKHRSTLKQENKPHKSGRHKTKGELKRLAQGKVSVKSISRKVKGASDKQARRNQALQRRKQQREDVLRKKRSRGGMSGAPILIMALGLGEASDVSSVLELLKTCDDEATVLASPLGIVHVSVPRFRQNLAFITPPRNDLYAVLDAAKVADASLILLDPDQAYDTVAEQCLRCLFAQGIPTPVLACKGLKELPLKRQGEGKKLLLKSVSKMFPDEKLHCLDTAQEGVQILRMLANYRPRDITYRDRRPHLLAEDVSFHLPSEESEWGTLQLTGYVRAQALSVNGLVHLPGWGDFQMLQMDSTADPYKAKNKADAMEETLGAPERPDPARQAPLQAEVDVDPMEGEQTWPTVEELAAAEAKQKAKTLKRVPRGTSEYQAAWILDEAGEEAETGSQASDLSDQEDLEAEMEAESDSEEEEEEEAGETEEQCKGSLRTSFNDTEHDEYETMLVRFGADVRYDEQMDLSEEESALLRHRQQRQDEMFPDEVDTPRDTPARIRFQKYRGLKSFRTSPWDPKENLPHDYSRIFQFENFNRTRRRVLKQLEQPAEGVPPGFYTTIHIANVPKEFMAEYRPGSPVIAFGLLDHEQRMSVCNYTLKRVPDYPHPVKSKDRMIFHVGYRRFSAAPIFSQHTNGDKHKFERFLRPSGMPVATVFAPIIFPTAPVLMFRQKPSGRHDLVATGNVLSVNPDRIVAKRLVLSGHPFRISKRHATVRYMFFNKEDIEWFKPVELQTKCGRRGHIKESLGTHGHMKCVFDGQLKSQDTVLMTLYKRVFPKWTYNARVQAPNTATVESLGEHPTMEDVESIYS